MELGEGEELVLKTVRSPITEFTFKENIYKPVDVSLTVHHRKYVEIKDQLDETDWFLLQNLLFAQHVSGTVMPIIRSSRVIQMAAAGGTWLFGLQVVGLVWSSGLCVRFAGCCSIPQTHHKQQPSA